jgi:hypothetical protein
MAAEDCEGEIAIGDHSRQALRLAHQHRPDVIVRHRSGRLVGRGVPAEYNHSGSAETLKRHAGFLVSFRQGSAAGISRIRSLDNPLGSRSMATSGRGSGVVRSFSQAGTARMSVWPTRAPVRPTAAQSLSFASGTSRVSRTAAANPAASASISASSPVDRRQPLSPSLTI